MTQVDEQKRQEFLAKLAEEKKRWESRSRDSSDKARHTFAGCATDQSHQLIVCIWCDPEHENPWCGDCHPRRCQSCDPCNGCGERIVNCLCGNFHEG